jgi:hypothetical protein
MFFGSQGKAVHVNTLIRASGVSLVRLDPREVRTFTLRETILAVKLELSGDDWVLSPAVHVKRGLSKNECSGIRHTSVGEVAAIMGIITSKVWLSVGVGRSVPVSSETGTGNVVKRTSILEHSTSIDEGTRISGNSSRTSESVNGVGKSIDGISVVEWLGTKNLEKKSIASQRRAIINILIGLDNPDKLLHGVVEVELDLVGRRTNRLITSELELSDQVLVGVLGHSASLIGIEEHIVNVQRGSNQRLVVGDGGRDWASNCVLTCLARVWVGVAVQGGNSPQALINRSDIKIDLDFVVLESNQGKGKTGVGAEPELKRDVKGCLRKSVTGGAHLTGSQRVTRGLNIRERRISDEGKLSGVTNHLEVSTLLLRGHCELVPDVHPVTILALDSLTSDLNLNLSNKLLTGEIQPTGIDAGVVSRRVVSKTHKLVNLGESNLKISAVGKISVSGDSALHTATEIGLAVECLFD